MDVNPGGDIVNFHVKQGQINDERADLIVVGLFQGEQPTQAPASTLDAALNGAMGNLIAAGDFAGTAGETVVLYTLGALAAPRLLLVGLGESAKFNGQAARSMAATVARKARDLGARVVAAALPGTGAGGVDALAAGQAVAEGTTLGLYRFRGYKSALPKDWKNDPETFTLIETGPERIGALEAGIARGETIAKGVKLARDMVNEPANFMTPTTIAGLATEQAAELGLRAQVLERADMVELGMGILLAVAAESEQPPKFVILEHNADRADLPTVVLVGKGVTFDSGGISLKPGEDMWRMKDDMAGAAAVIGALMVAARLKLPLHVVGLAPCAENLPGGRAQKPGDVFTGMTGKTMEVISTDAEGRMLLADALAYAGRFNPAAVVDIATLTGAQAVALGPMAAGLFSNDEALATKLADAAAASGERVWRLPLYDEYLEGIKSQVADVKNSGGRSGGIGTSAKFLEHFTDGYPWAHIDMASMAWGDEDKPVQPKGATGYGVRLFTALLESWAQ
jgi:leucyl aminopeptidase